MLSEEYEGRRRERGDTCQHCWGPVKGHASVNGQKLCHPDFGLDCYHLATVYGHEMPCPQCVDVRVLLDRR